MSPTPSIWSTLRHRPFRGLWLGGALYFIGNAMQTMAAAWMMIELTGSSFLAALVQTAVFLPMFLLSLPAGVLADITDRRRLMLLALTVQTVLGTLLAVLLLSKVGGAATVLIMIFMSGCCTALLSPAWNSTVGDSIPREELPQAITAVAIAYNAARALGPAIAGVVFTLVGGAWNFVIAVLSTLLMAHSIQRWPPRPHPPSRLPAERLWGGILSALHFARHSHTVLRRALADAERLGLVSRNAAAAAKAPAVVDKEQSTWTPAELSTFLSSVADHRLFAAFVLSATTGMRRRRWRLGRLAPIG